MFPVVATEASRRNEVSDIIGITIPACVHFREKMIFIAGIMTGFTLWTKNEGVLFTAVCVAVIALDSFLNDGWKNAVRKVIIFLVLLLVFVGLFVIVFGLMPTEKNR